MKRKALLIQDISDFVLYLRPALTPILEKYMNTVASEESIVLWIIRDKIERIYHLVDREHDSGRTIPNQIVAELEQSFPTDFDQVFTTYIKVPRLYGDDTDVKVRFKGRDLFLYYLEESQIRNLANPHDYSTSTPSTSSGNLWPYGSIADHIWASI